MWKSKEDNYKPIKQIIKLFSKVNVSIIKHDSDPLKYNVTKFLYLFIQTIKKFVEIFYCFLKTKRYC